MMKRMERLAEYSEEQNTVGLLPAQWLSPPEELSGVIAAAAERPLSLERMLRWAVGACVVSGLVGAFSVPEAPAKPRPVSVRLAALPPSTAPPESSPTTFLPVPRSSKAAPAPTARSSVVPRITTAPKPLPSRSLPTTTILPKTATHGMVHAAGASDIVADVSTYQCAYFADMNHVPKYIPLSSNLIVQGTDRQPDYPKNPCLVQEATYDGRATQFYFMAGARGPDGFRYGFDTMHNAIQVALDSGLTVQQWWLDIEPGQNDRHEPLWTSSTAVNVAAIKGEEAAIDDAAKTMRAQASLEGIYSTRNFMKQITGSPVWPERVGMWLPIGSTSPASIRQNCASYAPANAFTEAPLPELLQTEAKLPNGDTLDVDVSWASLCGNAAS